MTAAPAGPRPLAVWLAVCFPSYRGALAALAALGLLVGLIAYAENRTLELIVGAMGAGRSPWAPLAVFASVGLARTLAGAAHTAISGRLEIRSRNDLEREILAHLLRRDDAFFRDRSSGEILNRLSGDVARAVRLRTLWMQNLRSSLLLCGNVWFFVLADWRLAVAAVMTTAVGLWLTARLTRPVQTMDREFLASDDRVKGRFEEVLGAAPEVQVGNLFARVVAAFGVTVAARGHVHRRYVRLQAWMTASSGLAYLVALLSLFVVTLVFLSGGHVAGAAALAPVFLKALPELFANASTLVYSRLDLRRAATSCHRLLEYQSAAVPEGRDAPADAGRDLVLDAVTLQYPGPGGARVGGVVDLDAAFARGSWTVVAGRAGAGKSTLLQVLCARARPQRGAVRTGGGVLHDLAPAPRADLLTLLPQKIVLLDSSVRENVLFGREGGHGVGQDLDDEDLAVLEAAGVGDICRRKALDLLPGDPASGLGAHIVALRARARVRLRDELALSVEPYEADGVDEQSWMIEALLDARGDRLGVLVEIGRAPAREAFRALAATESGRLLDTLARSLVDETRELLRLPTAAAYNSMAPLHLDEMRWRARKALADGAAGAPPALEVALGATMGELRALPVYDESRVRAMLAGKSIDAAPLMRAMAAHVRPYDVAALHPHLTWRENLVFAAYAAGNRRIQERADTLLMDLVREEGLGPALTRLGLGYQVGRGGDRLSGGQRQLVALARALLRKTAILILDEPTAALDPASRDRVILLLRAWRADRIVITVSHDPELLAAADRVLLIDGGRLVASGAYADLRNSSPELRAVFREGQRAP